MKNLKESFEKLSIESKTLITFIIFVFITGIMCFINEKYFNPNINNDKIKTYIEVSDNLIRYVNKDSVTTNDLKKYIEVKHEVEQLIK